MNRVLHCLTCGCVLASVVEMAQHELDNHLVVSYPKADAA